MVIKLYWASKVLIGLHLFWLPAAVWRPGGYDLFKFVNRLKVS